MTETTETAPRDSGVLASAAEGLRIVPCQTATLAVLALIAAMVALRCLVARHVDLETDEAYYWLWSRHLTISYYDHPPMIAYLIRLGTALFGDTVFGVRSMAIACMIAASAAVYGLTVVLFDDRRLGVLAALWFNMMPHTAFFSIVMYPDTPAILFWLLCCLALALVWKTGRGTWWYAAGAAMGLLAAEQIYRRIPVRRRRDVARRLAAAAALAETARTLSGGADRAGAVRSGHCLERGQSLGLVRQAVRPRAG